MATKQICITPENSSEIKSELGYKVVNTQQGVKLTREVGDEMEKIIIVPRGTIITKCEGIAFVPRFGFLQEVEIISQAQQAPQPTA